jgi:omega-6 fatty acid desaturase (delta-12 desaturase)
MSSEARSLAAVVRVIPAACYDNPTWKGLLWLARDLLLYAGVVAALIWVDHPLLLLPLWVLAGLSISALFILGHDAAHRALFKSDRLNYTVGQLTLLPSLHLFEAWVFGHNRVHHGHTTREGMDYVWHPVTPAEFAALTPWGKLAHRIKWSFLGAGIYYMHEIWWDKMIWNFVPPSKHVDAIQHDRVVVGTYAALVTIALLATGFATYGTAGGALWMWVKVFLVPFVVWNYSIGFAVYVHHICPKIPWHKRREWDKFTGQVQGTTVIHLPAWINTFYHNIFLHVAHHVDMRIPFYGLPAATDALRKHFAEYIVERRYNLSDYVDSTKNCKLFDFESGTWLKYDDPVPVPATEVAAAG